MIPKDYLKDILPRIKKYSKKLDNITALVDIPWTLYDDFGRKVIYIFKRNSNQLIVSINGDVTLGKWELINSEILLIQYDETKLLLNHSYLDNKLFILQKDNSEELFGFINTQLVSPNDIPKLLDIMTETYIDEPMEISKDNKKRKRGCLDDFFIVIGLSLLITFIIFGVSYFINLLG